jgi:hypothetical protein
LRSWNSIAVDIRQPVFPLSTNGILHFKTGTTPEGNQLMNFSVDDTGGGGADWLDIYVGEGTQALQKWTNTGGTRVVQKAVPCHTFTFGSMITQGSGVPWNVFNPPQLLLKAFCTNSSITADVGPSTYVYHQGYAWNGQQWNQVNFTCTGGDKIQTWCPNSASAPIPNNSTFYVAYTCNWTGTKWNCGCADTACTQNLWQLQKIR